MKTEMEQPNCQTILTRVSLCNADSVRFSHSLRSVNSKLNSMTPCLSHWNQDQQTQTSEIWVPKQSKLIETPIKNKVMARTEIQYDLLSQSTNYEITNDESKQKVIENNFSRALNSEPQKIQISKRGLISEHIMVGDHAKRQCSKKLKFKLNAIASNNKFIPDKKKQQNSLLTFCNCQPLDVPTILKKSEPHQKYIIDAQNMEKEYFNSHNHIFFISKSGLTADQPLKQQQISSTQSLSPKIPIVPSSQDKSNQLQQISTQNITESEEFVKQSTAMATLQIRVQKINQEIENEQNLINFQSLISFKQLIPEMCIDLQKSQSKNSDYFIIKKLQKDNQQRIITKTQFYEKQLIENPMASLSYSQIVKNIDVVHLNKLQKDNIGSEMNEFKISSKQVIQDQLQVISPLQTTQTVKFKMIAKDDKINQINQINLQPKENQFQNLEMYYTYICIPSPNIPIESNLERNRKKLDQIKLMIIKGKNRFDIDDNKSPVQVQLESRTNGRLYSSYNNRFNENLQSPQIIPLKKSPLRQQNRIPRANPGRAASKEKKVEPQISQSKGLRSVSLGRGQQQQRCMQMSLDKKSGLNRFKKLKYLGKGYLSDVYSVIDSLTGMMGALKIIQKSIIESKGLNNLLINEIKIQSIVNHPNILKCYGVFQDSKQIALLLELSDCTLQQYLQNAKLSKDEIISIIFQVILGVNHLHQIGIIHRDIKPENILIRQGVVKVADMGISVYANSSTQFCGTRGYMAPEVEDHQRYDSKADCYSIGKLIEEMGGQQITELKSVMVSLLENNSVKRISLRSCLEQKIFKDQFRKIQKNNEMIQNTIL